VVSEASGFQRGFQLSLVVDTSHCKCQKAWSHPPGSNRHLLITKLKLCP